MIDDKEKTNGQIEKRSLDHDFYACSTASSMPALYHANHLMEVSDITVESRVTRLPVFSSSTADQCTRKASVVGLRKVPLSVTDDAVETSL